MKKEDLNRMARESFAANPGTKEFHQTADGHCYSSDSGAIEHAKSLENKEVRKVTPDSVKEVKASGSGNSSTPSAEERVEAVKAVKTLEELEALAKGEKAKAVKAAIKEKRAELEAAAENIGEASEDDDKGSDSQTGDEE